MAVMVKLHSATKPHLASHSLPRHWDGGDNQKGKPDEACDWDKNSLNTYTQNSAQAKWNNKSSPFPMGWQMSSNPHKNRDP